MEAAARRDPRGIRRLAAEDDRPSAHRWIGDRHDREERLGVGVPRVREHLARRPVFDDPAEIHDRDPIRIRRDRREVVGDHHHRDAALAGQHPEQVEDVRADAHVEHADRLVGDQQVRLQGQAGGDHDALALAAGQLEREAAEVRADGRQPGRGQRLLHPLAELLPGRDAMDPQRLGHDVADAHPRVQRLVRILEHHLHLAAEAHQAASGELADLLAIEDDAARARRRSGPSAGFPSSSCRSRTRRRGR